LEKSAWTKEWTRPKGQVIRSFNGPTEVWECIEHPGETLPWSPLHTSALWLRIAETPTEQVFERWGPMRRYSEETYIWDQAIELLHVLRTLWRNDESVSPPSPVPLIFAPGRGAEATLRELGDALLRLRSVDASANDIGLSFQRETYTWVIRARSLRAMVLLDAGRAVHQRARYLRCRTCQQWLEMARRDQIFCSSACRAAAFRADGGGHAER
jgi:hypothetical protein